METDFWLFPFLPQSGWHEYFSKTTRPGDKTKRAQSANTIMTPRTEVINHQVINWVEQLACFLKVGDIFRKPRGSTQYKFEELKLDLKTVVCWNTDTQMSENIYSNSPVFKLVVL